MEGGRRVGRCVEGRRTGGRMMRGVSRGREEDVGGKRRHVGEERNRRGSDVQGGRN